MLLFLIPEDGSLTRRFKMDVSSSRELVAYSDAAPTLEEQLHPFDVCRLFLLAIDVANLKSNGFSLASSETDIDIQKVNKYLAKLNIFAAKIEYADQRDLLFLHSEMVVKQLEHASYMLHRRVRSVQTQIKTRDREFDEYKQKHPEQFAESRRKRKEIEQKEGQRPPASHFRQKRHELKEVLPEFQSFSARLDESLDVARRVMEGVRLGNLITL